MQYCRANFDEPEGVIPNKPFFKKTCARCQGARNDAENQIPVTNDRSTYFHCQPYRQDWWQLYDGSKIQPCVYYNRSMSDTPTIATLR